MNRKYLENKFLILIKKINLDYAVIYSFNSGYYYVNNYSIIEKIYSEDGIYSVEYSLHKKIHDSALDPKNLNIQIFTNPIVVDIMFSNICNLRCKYCISTYANSYSFQNLFITYVQELSKRINESHSVGVVISGGEPTLNPELISFLKLINSNLFFCALDTNGVSFSKHLVNTVKSKYIIPRISLDSLNEEINNDVRGMYDRVLLTINYLLREEVEFRINTVLSSRNKDDLENLGKWMIANNIKRWHIFKLQRTYAPKDLWISDEETQKIITNLQKKVGNELHILSKFITKTDGFASFIIDSSGECFSSKGTEKICFGNIFQQSIQEIWGNTPIEYRSRHINKYIYYRNKIL